ncbi:xanthine dehydrogenase small subunit [Telmatospirillum sp.]|uniref:xanthine dehydrogenase small subunit n=1 Tax=Telmatospirillum sp. TaxID=2079197 RepID=UPI00284D5B06|nr:xanthine dehydrogenase small subunit [Telmatospirillum sp.]MDR3437310.1 xanthine dehydrogenase small subunit [Telmatospirillum sp.]
MRNTITTNINGRDVTISDVPPDQMALAWLRAEGFISVKEGCGEGDCGACTVALGVPTADGLDWRAVASCLLFLPMLDGRAVLTAEGLKGPNGNPHPVQQAMADGFGTQCGFCSPGFTMSLFALAHHDRLDDQAIYDSLAGNLCRCTGYRPIIEVARALPNLAADPGEAAVAERLRAAAGAALFYCADGLSFFAPTDLREALAYRSAHPDAWILAGGTDLGLAVTKRHQRPEVMLSLARVPELTRITDNHGSLTIGAAVPYAEILSVISTRHPELAKLLRRVGATQVRNQGTFGGNLGNASPIGDSLPALIALGATIDIAAPDGLRTVAAQDFVTGYRKTQLAADELIAAVHLPDLPPGELFRAYKVAKRVDQDISTVSASFRLRLENGKVAAIAAAFGGVAARPVRAHRLEAALQGLPWTAASLAGAQAALAEDIAPQDDLRGTAGYRRKVATNLVTRLWHETTNPTEFPVSLDRL